jgi:cold shock CspA family protein
MEHNDAIEALIREKADWLDRFTSDIMSCRVVVEPAGKHHQRGNLIEVRIDLTVPGEEIVVTREPSEHTEYRDFQVALRDAFDTTRRKLEEYVRRRRKDIKAHETPPHGRVSQIFPLEDHGFIKTPTGRDIYFHRNSVANDAFDRLDVGSEVTFVEVEGEKGPQASTVRLVGKHHHV